MAASLLDDKVLDATVEQDKVAFTIADQAAPRRSVRRGREPSRGGLAPSVHAPSQAVSPSAAESEKLADLFPEIKGRKKRRAQRRERVLEHPAPRAAALAVEPTEHGRPVGPPAESTDLWGWIEA